MALKPINIRWIKTVLGHTEKSCIKKYPVFYDYKNVNHSFQKVLLAHDFGILGTNKTGFKIIIFLSAESCLYTMR